MDVGVTVAWLCFPDCRNRRIFSCYLGGRLRKRRVRLSSVLPSLSVSSCSCFLSLQARVAAQRPVTVGRIAPIGPRSPGYFARDYGDTTLPARTDDLVLILVSPLQVLFSPHPGRAHGQDRMSHDGDLGCLLLRLVYCLLIRLRFDRYLRMNKGLKSDPEFHARTSRILATRAVLPPGILLEPTMSRP